VSEEKRFKGSFTIEAAYIMAMVLITVAVIIGQAGKNHDRAAGAMVLHEAVEKSRHEREESAGELAARHQEYMRLLLSFPSYELQMEKKGRTVTGTGTGGDWNYVIEMKEFRPERFLRQVTLLESLGETDED
jgi:hypothetical protein